MGLLDQGRRRALLAALAICGACASSDSSSPLDSLPANLREMARNATGFEEEALADGWVTRAEMIEGIRLQAECLADLGLTASVDELGQLAVVGAPPSDFQLDGCAKGNSEVIPLVYSVITFGSPEVQRQRQIDCLIAIGVLPEGATAEDLAEFLDYKKTNGMELTTQEVNCMAAATQ